MNIYQQLRVVRACLRNEGKSSAVFCVCGQDCEGIERDWCVEVRSDDTDAMLKRMRDGMRRVSGTNVTRH